MIVTQSNSSARPKTLLDYLKIDKSLASLRTKDLYSKIAGLFAFHKIDEETAMAIFKSFEARFGMADDLEFRLEKFDSFLKAIDTRENLIDSVKNVGLLSMSELENHAQETGDWLPAIKKAFEKYDVKPEEMVRHTSDLKEKDDSQANAVGSEANIQ